MIATSGRAARGSGAARDALPSGGARARRTRVVVPRSPALSVDAASRGLVAFDVRLDPRDVVFVKGVVEASDGLATIFADQGGDGGELCIACPPSRAAELRALLADLGCEGRERPSTPSTEEGRA